MATTQQVRQSQPQSNKRLTLIACIFCLIGALGLSTESILSLLGKSLCRTTACEIVGRYLVFGEPLLITAGALLFWSLTLLLFFNYRYPERFSRLPFLVLAGAMSFDGSLIGFQFFTIGQKCQFCITVAGFLFLVSLLFCLARRKIFLFTFLLLAWLGGFASHGIIEMPEPGGAAKLMTFYTKRSTTVPPDQAVVKTLIFSMECPHCLQVIDRLATMDTNASTWRFASVDRDKNALMKISSFINQAPQTNNPFQLLKEIKEGQTTQTSIRNDLYKRSKKALSFLSNMNINGIPTLIIKKSEDERQILTGSEAIIKHIEENSSLKNQ